ncbi:hypothetical protein [Nocardia sp. NPDC004860]|uniref:hypothetical protein n=1 Tax=Nocardia sp. NPDC004860 TaxID=3154557 RepID=UPI0033AA302C
MTTQPHPPYSFGRPDRHGRYPVYLGDTPAGHVYRYEGTWWAVTLTGRPSADHHTRADAAATLTTDDATTPTPTPSQPIREGQPHTMTAKTSGPDRRALHLLDVHRPEAELLAQLAGVDTVRIVSTGGGCEAIEIEAGPLMDPTGTLYLLVTSNNSNGLAERRDEITAWTVAIFDNPECTGEPLSYSERPASFAAAYTHAWHALYTDRPGLYAAASRRARYIRDAARELARRRKANGSTPLS